MKYKISFMRKFSDNFYNKILRLSLVTFFFGFLFVFSSDKAYAVNCITVNGTDVDFEVNGTVATARVQAFDENSGNWVFIIRLGDGLLTRPILEEWEFPRGTGTQYVSRDFGYIMNGSSTNAEFYIKLRTRGCVLPIIRTEGAFGGGTVTSVEFDSDRCSLNFSGLVISGPTNTAENKITVNSNSQTVTTRTGSRSWNLGRIDDPASIPVKVESMTGPVTEIYSGTINVTPCQSNIFDPNDPENNNPVSCIINVGGEEVEGVLTAIGCIPVDSTALANWAIMFGMIIGGMVAVFKIIQGSFMVMTSTGNPDALQEGRSIITAAVVGLIVILSAVVLLSFIGFDILGLQRFGFSL